MKIKMLLGLVLTGILTVSVLTGCSVDISKGDVSLKPSVEQGIQEDNESLKEETKKILVDLAGLMGKEDAVVVEMLGEGVPSKAKGSVDILARAYTLPILGANVLANVGYNENGKVANVSIQLNGTDLESYEKVMTEIFGENKKIEEDTKEEEGNGKRAISWEVEGKDITLLRVYDNITIEVYQV